MIKIFLYSFIISFQVAYAGKYPSFFYKNVIDNYSKKAPILHVALSRDTTMPVSKAYLEKNPQLAGVFNEFMKGKKTTFDLITDYKSKNEDFNIRKDNYIKYLDPKNKDATVKFEYFVKSLPDDRWIYAADTGDLEIYMDHLYFDKFDHLGFESKCGALNEEYEKVEDFPYSTKARESCVCTIGCAMIEVNMDIIDRVIDTRLKVTQFDSFKRSLYTINEFIGFPLSFAQKLAMDTFSFGSQEVDLDTNNINPLDTSSFIDQAVDSINTEFKSELKEISQDVKCKSDSYVKASDNLDNCKKPGSNCSEALLKKYQTTYDEERKKRDDSVKRYVKIKAEIAAKGVKLEDIAPSTDGLLAFAEYASQNDNVNIREVGRNLSSLKRVGVKALSNDVVKDELMSADIAGINSDIPNNNRILSVLDKDTAEVKYSFNLSKYDQEFDITDEKSYKEKVHALMLSSSAKAGISITNEEASKLANQYYEKGVTKINVYDLTKGKINPHLDPNKSDDLTEKSKKVAKSYNKREELKSRRLALIAKGFALNSPEILNINSEIGFLNTEITKTTNEYFDTKQKSDRDQFLTDEQFKKEQRSRNIKSNLANATDDKILNRFVSNEYPNRTIKNASSKSKQKIMNKLQKINQERLVHSSKYGAKKASRFKQAEIDQLHKELASIEETISKQSNPYEVASTDAFLYPFSSSDLDNGLSKDANVNQVAQRISSEKVTREIMTPSYRKIASVVESTDDKDEANKSLKYLIETRETLYIYESFFFDKHMTTSQKLDLLKTKYSLDRKIVVLSESGERLALDSITEEGKSTKLYSKLKTNPLYQSIVK